MTGWRAALIVGAAALLMPSPVLAHGFHGTLGDGAHGWVHALELLAVAGAAFWLGRRWVQRRASGR